MAVLVSLCGRFSLWPFSFVAVLVVAVLVWPFWMYTYAFKGKCISDFMALLSSDFSLNLSFIHSCFLVN